MASGLFAEVRFVGLYIDKVIRVCERVLKNISWPIAGLRCWRCGRFVSLGLDRNWLNGKRTELWQYAYRSITGMV
jgi:hypothetical protein